MEINSFADLIVWQKAHQLVLFIYKKSDTFPKSEEFGLKNQLRRAAVSIPSNIAEGFKRKSQKDSLHFYNIAEGSLEEARHQILLSRDLDYINEKDYKELVDLAEETSKLLCGWIKSQSIGA